MKNVGSTTLLHSVFIFARVIIFARVGNFANICGQNIH